MGRPTGFIEYERRTHTSEPVEERIRHWREFSRYPAADELRRQGARCMDCGIPFCHSDHGCPLWNLIPEFNDLVFRDRWQDAIRVLHSTNNFPEFTGRICPAPCETACVLGINEPPVAIKQNEVAIIERAFDEGWVKARPPLVRSGRMVAVVGSGPAGLATAAQLNSAGHLVTVFEREDRVGGLLRYGIPDFKLEKNIIDRRLDILREEGVCFRTNAEVGVNVPVEELREFDAVCLTGGSTRPRDLPVPGRELRGVQFAMPFLTQQNRRVAGDMVPDEGAILAGGKHVIVIGGGDTGSDCVGTSIRQGARSVTQVELLSRPPEERAADNPWPQWSRILRTSSSQEEGCNRQWDVLTKRLEGDGRGRVKKLHAVKLKWKTGDNGRPACSELPGSEFTLDAELVLLAMGFLYPEPDGMLSQLGVELDGRGNVKTDADMMTSVPGTFAAGDMRRGQSLVVWALTEGRSAAFHIDRCLMGHSDLPAPPAAR